MRRPVPAFEERQTRGHLDVEGLRLTGFTAMHTHTSVHLRVEIPRPEAADLLQRIASLTGGRYAVRGTVGDVEGLYSVASFTSRRGTAILVVHTRTDEALLTQLVPLVGARRVTLRLGVPVELQPAPQEPPIQDLLPQAAAAARKDPAALLQELTTFRNKAGRIVHGVRDPEKLSEASARVVRSKLLALLGREAGSTGGSPRRVRPAGTDTEPHYRSPPPVRHGAERNTLQEGQAMEITTGYPKPVEDGLRKIDAALELVTSAPTTGDGPPAWAVRHSEPEGQA